jgi:hypothetical protein
MSYKEDPMYYPVTRQSALKGMEECKGDLPAWYLPALDAYTGNEPDIVAAQEARAELQSQAHDLCFKKLKSHLIEDYKEWKAAEDERKIFGPAATQTNQVSQAWTSITEDFPSLPKVKGKGSSTESIASELSKRFI